MFDLFKLCCSEEEEAKRDGIWNDVDGDSEYDPEEMSPQEEDIVTQSKWCKEQRRKQIYCQVKLDSEFKAPIISKSDEEKKFIAGALSDRFIFANLHESQRHMLIDAMEKDTVDKGKILINQGDTGDYFYILQEGLVSFIKDNETLGSCKRGGSFGELSLLYDCPRAVTCLAQEASVLWKVGQKTFRCMMALQTQEYEQDLRTVIQKVPLFEHLTQSEITRFTDALTLVAFPKGKRIISHHQKGEFFYIIKEGTVRCHDIGLGGSMYIESLLLNAGEWFGERALLTGEPRAASVTAVTDVTCYCLDRKTFESAIGSLQRIIEKGLNKKFLQTLPIFSNSDFDEHEIDELAALLSEQCFKKGKMICEVEKPVSRDLWIIKEGKIVVTDKKGGIFALESGDYYGDKFIKDGPECLSSQTAIFEENSTCFVLTHSDIVDIIGDISRLGKSIPFTNAQLNKSITLRNLKKHRVIGEGGFGKVWLSSYIKDGAPYALKEIEKRKLIQTNQVDNVFNEKNIMSSIKHPFLLSMVSSFQDEHYLYLLLELVPGGELFSLIYEKFTGGLGSTSSIFYSSCIVEAISHLHRRSICYRDLKPENVLIGADGYCTIVDMGFCKVVMDKTYTFCGTPEYVAPEIIASVGHNKAVDYWAIGVLMYEMLVGKTPFYDEGAGQHDLFKRIVKGQYEIPNSVDDDAKDLIQKLLVRHQTKRLGNKCGGSRSVKDHAWFKDVKWSCLTRKELKAPWLPTIKDPFDSSYFSAVDGGENNRPGFFQRLPWVEQKRFKGF